MKELEKRIILVDGSIRSLGRLIAKELVQQAIVWQNTEAVQQIKNNPGPRDRWGKVK